MDDLIRRSDAIRVANEIPELIENHYFGEGEAERMMKEIPAVDAISLGVGTIQVERDTAIAQLAELGIGFGQKAPDMVEVVRCRDCKHWFPLRNFVEVGNCNRNEWSNTCVPGGFFCADGKSKKDAEVDT